MSDDKLPDLDDIDWDTALDQWEKSSFAPEAPTKTGATTAPLAEEAALAGLPSSSTLVASIPAELRPEAQKAAPESARTAPPAALAMTAEAPVIPPQRTSKGGLGQLFAKRPSGEMAAVKRTSSGESPAVVAPEPAPPTVAPPPAEAGPVRLHDDEPELGNEGETKQTVVRPSLLAPPMPPTSRSTSPTDDDEDVDTLVADRSSLAPPAVVIAAMPSSGPVDYSYEPPPSLVPTTERLSARPAEPPVSADVSFEGEKPGSGWLDARAADAFRRRAEWLEDEARALEDPTEQARALLSVSEMLALVGELEHARVIAGEARDLAPGHAVALARVQARALSGATDASSLAEALDAEAKDAPTQAARLHATLLAADALREAGMADAADARWEAARAIDAADVRATIATAAVALARDDVASPALALPRETPLGRAIATAKGLRGEPEPDDAAFPFPVNAALARARAALARGDAATVASTMSGLAATAGLGDGAAFLSAAFGALTASTRRASADVLRARTEQGDPVARRMVAARGLELDDAPLVERTLANGDFAVIEHAVLRALAGLGSVPGTDVPALDDALSADGPKRATCTSGAPDTRVLVTLGRRLAQGSDDAALDEAVRAAAPLHTPGSDGIALARATAQARWLDVAAELRRLPGENAAGRHLAAGLLAARAGDHAEAARSWAAAYADGARHEAILRARAADGDAVDLALELAALADELPEGVAASVLRLEVVARELEGARRDAREAPVERQLGLLERVHRGAPHLGLGAFYAERIGRRRGDLTEVLRWIHERAAYASDPFEAALDAVREAFLVADRDPERASVRLEEAHAARPDDVALRELYERLATDAPRDRAAWREARAAKAEGAPRALLFTEAALEYERTGDGAGALRAARAAMEAGDIGLSRLVAERAESAAGERGRVEADLLREVEESDPARATQRREARERLADRALARGDRDEALGHHRAILTEEPGWLPSLHALEQELASAGDDAGLAPVAEQIAVRLDGTPGGEVTAHAQLAARLRARESGWERTAMMARLAATQPTPSLWSLRALNAHARLQADADAELETTRALLERTQRPLERAALLLRLSEIHTRLSRPDDARACIEQASTEDPGDVVTWGFLAELRERGGDGRAAAEACEALARASQRTEHQLLAWYDAARLWLEVVRDHERGMSALEAAAEVDVEYADVFTRLSGLYAERRLDAELARLLERRLERIEDPAERMAMEVDLARALVDMGEVSRARGSLERALEAQPDHTAALEALAGLCEKEADWAGAEQAYVRLARLLPEADDQRKVYEKLGTIYATHAPNLSRAEVALREVLKRAPHHVPTLEKLVDVYKRQGDVPRAVEVQQEIVGAETDPEARLRRLVELAGIYEASGRDLRKAEQALEAARKEFPTSVVALRALAEFYRRQRQMPAMQILLDRAAGDARRAFAAGRFVPSLFEVLHAAYDLRGKADAARVVAATLAAVEGQPATLRGADARALDPALDDILAPELVGPGLRTLLFQLGDVVDAATPVDLRALRATPMPPGRLAQAVGAIATFVGLGALQVFVSPELGRVAIPLATTPPTLLVGAELADTPNEAARAFVLARALKAIVGRSSALLRGAPEDVAVTLAALFVALNPSFVPQGVDARKASDLARRMQPMLPRNLDPTMGVLALEAAGLLGPHLAAIGHAGSAWGNRVGLLAVGDPSAALDAVAWARGEDAAPASGEERASWVARSAEARELLTFSVGDGYSEARARLGLGT